MSDIDYLIKYYNGDIEEGKRRLKNGEPIQYIVGNIDFYGYILDINSNVLIPRFETEELVEKTIRYANRYFDNKIDIVDLGTGSGCIAIALKQNLNCNIDAVDISGLALDVAKKNNDKYNLDINFYLGDMLNPLNKKYDLIISNPPYIADDEDIMDIVKNNEPHNALYALNDGLKYYYEIIKDSSKYLKEKSIIAFEIGSEQGLKIKEFVNEFLPNSNISIKKDIQGNDRFVFIFNNL